MQAERGSGSSGAFLDFRGVLALFRQHIWFIAGTVAIGLLIGLAYVIKTPNRYTAVAEVLFETRLQNVSGLQAVLPGLTTDRSEIESQIEILGSLQVFDRAAATLLAEHRRTVRFRKNRATRPSGRRERSGPNDLDLSSIAESLSTAVGRQGLRKQLTITRRGLSYIMEIEFTDKSPELAARVANAVADAYIAFRREEKLRATQWASKQLEVRVLKVGQEVRKAYALLQQFKTDHNLFKIKELDLTERQLSDHIEKLSEARDRATRAEAIVLQTKHLGGDADRLRSLDKVLDSKVVLELRGQFARVQRQLSIAEGRYGSSHVSVSNARAELDNLNRLITKEIERLVNNSLNELDMARIQVALLTKELDKLKLNYSGRNKARIELAELERQAEAKQQLYTALLKRLRETEAEVGMQTDDASITYRAAPPDLPSWPKRKLTLGLMLFGSLGLGCVLALAREAFNDTFRSVR
ncbi:MAG: GumC family protein, partial [Boseongicola sp.]